MMRQRDCAARALQYGVGLDYSEACRLINEAAKYERLSKRKPSRSSAKSGVYVQTMHRVMRELGWKWTPTMKIGQGCRIHLRKEELPNGRIIVRVSKHFVAMIDGFMFDPPQVARNGTRCVYGYWSRIAQA